MTDTLQDVISAAADGSARRATPLRAVEADWPAATHADDAVPASVAVASVAPGAAWIPASTAALPGPAAASGGAPLEHGSLRMAFLLCSFQDALLDRRRQGERLTPREDSLLALSRAEFAHTRPQVVGWALARLNAVAEGVLDEVASPPGSNLPRITPMETFALDSLRNLSRRANQLLQDDGQDAALSLFGDAAAVQDPLAIYQLVFTTALRFLEAFEQVNPSGSKLLARVADGLGSEVERILEGGRG